MTLPRQLEIEPGFSYCLSGANDEFQGVATLLIGELLDHAALHGLMAQIGARGLVLVEIRSLPSPP